MFNETTTSATTTRTLNNIKKSLSHNLKNKYGIDDENIVNEMLSYHGIDKPRFDFVKSIENVIAENLNDVSIDANSNKNEKTIEALQQESIAPVKKAVGFDYLYRQMKDLFGKEEAIRLSGEMYDLSIGLSDSTNVLKPYSYYENTPIICKINGQIKYLTMKKLFDNYKEFSVYSDQYNMDEIMTDKLYKKVSVNKCVVKSTRPKGIFCECNDPIKEKIDIEIWDNNYNGWVNISRIIRHKNDKKMVLYQTTSGDFAFVTEDHPVYMADSTEKNAIDLKIGDDILNKDVPSLVEDKIHIPEKLAYVIGFILGDGNMHCYDIDQKYINNPFGHIKFTRGGNLVSIYQNNIDDANVVKVINEIFDGVKMWKFTEKSERQINFSSMWLNQICTEYFGFSFHDDSFSKRLPENILSWEKSSIEALVAGLIDSDGTVFSADARIDIRMRSYAIINELADILKMHGVCGVRKRIIKDDIIMFGVAFRPTNGIVEYCEKLTKISPDILNNAINSYNDDFDTKPRNNSIQKIYVVDDEKLLERCEMVYDITTSTGSFYANGMVQHNCWSVDASKIVSIGRPFGQLHSKPAKRVSSYISALCETVHQMSSHLAGAIAIGTYFLDIAHLSIYKEKYDLRELKTNKEYRKKLENEMQQFVHSVNHLSRNGAECFTPDVEVLTVDGFKKYNEVCVGDLVYTWNDGRMEIQPIDKVNIYDYKGEMHRYSGRDITQCNTPNHRILAKKNNSTEYVLKESVDFINSKTPTSIPIAFKEYNCEDYNISDDMLKLVTIILTDGSIDKDNDRFSITKSENRYGNELINNLLNKLNIDYDASIRETTFEGVDGLEEKYKKRTYNVNVYRTRGDLSIVKKYVWDKNELPIWFNKLSRRQAKLVIETWAKFDGSGDFDKDSEKIKMQCDNYNIADKLQVVAMIAGYGSTIKTRIIGKNKKETIYVCLRKRPNKDYNKKEIINYDGIVWCPTTKNGIVMFRDKNKSVFISGNSPFTNISIFDRVKLKTIISDMAWYFPYDELPITHPEYDDEEQANEFYLNYIIDYIQEIQEIFLNFFNKGDPLKNGMPYRFPIVTINFGKKKWGEREIIEDVKFLRSMCKKDIYRYNIFVSEGTKLASCCRLINDVEMLDFASQSNSFGAGGSISLGSHRVCTINFMRAVIEANSKEQFFEILENRINDSAKILKAHKTLIKKLTEKGLQPFISNGWININRLFSTFGIIGMYEASKKIKEKFGDDSDIEGDILTFMNEKVKEMSKKYDIIGNIEQIPGESFAIRLCRADKLLFGEKEIPYQLYSNQFIPLWEDATIWEKLDADGKYNKLITGGGIVHATIGEKVTAKQAEKIIKYCVNSGCEHFALNAVYSECENGHVSFGDCGVCPVCSGEIVEKLTRVVGFFTPVSSWQDTRREWEFPRRTIVDLEKE